VTLIQAVSYKPERRGFDSDEVTVLFHVPNPSNRAISLGSTNPLTEMSTRNLPGLKRRPACKADNLTAIC
jgi:hypothetical protein